MSNSYPISICMAGAVSAGAYSAGVMTELLNALHLWLDSGEKLPSKPKHRIVLKGFTGASAGSIQAVLSSLDLFAEDKKQELGKKTWFAASLNNLLELDDLKKGEPVRSLLNSDALKVIANQAVSEHKWGTIWPSFIHEPFELRLSVTNLRGVPYNVSFPKGNPTEFGMSTHNEYMRYEVSQHPSSSLTHYVIPFNHPDNEALQDLINGALASSAFPVAFAPVELRRPASADGKDYHTEKSWLNAIKARTLETGINVDFKTKNRPPSWKYDQSERIFAVDGGATNNEPLIEAFRILLGDEYANWRAPDAQAPGRIIMIDPFPNPVDKIIDAKVLRVDKGLGALISALIGHARFSEPLMVSEQLQSRVGLIYPSLPGRVGRLMALRSGALSGFAGFLKSDFMQHDYVLGRLNMRRFLRYHFTLPEDDPLFNRWSAADKKAWRVSKKGEQAVLPIIPVYHKSSNNEYEIFNVDSIEKEDYYKNGLRNFQQKFNKADKQDLSKKLKRRFIRVGLMMLENHKDFNNEKGDKPSTMKSKDDFTSKIYSWFSSAKIKVMSVPKASFNAVMNQGWRFFGAGFLTRAVIRTLEDALQEQGTLDYQVERKSNE